jgi:hypothetical protein
MDVEIRATFDTRRSAELAVEHLVQEHGLNRTDIFINAAGKANSAGAEPSGADVTPSLSEPRNADRADLNGAIDISVGCEQSLATVVKAALKEAGATGIQ